MMLYRFFTNSLTPKFNINIRVRDEERYTSVRLNQYEYLTDLDPADPSIPGLKSYLLNTPLDSNCFEIETGLSAGLDGDKRADIGKIPDFWTVSPLPICTQAFKDFIEGVDPGLHQFFEFDLFYHKTSEQIRHTRFYTFVCGRLLDIEPDDEVPRRSSYFGPPLGKFEAPKLRTVQVRSDIQAYIADLPIWSFRTAGRNAYYISAELLQASRAQGLKGFTEYNKRARGNVGHVKYES